MSGPRSVLSIYFVVLSLCFLHACISFTISGRQKRYDQNDICPESKPTVEQVDDCPPDIETLTERSNKKKCNNYIQCGGEPLVYHCVTFDGKLVEVCAPRSVITGSCCTIYDQGLGRVIEDFNKLCSSCPFQYNSDEYIKNRECLLPIGPKEDPSEQTSSPDNTNLIKTTTKPSKTTHDIIVGDYEGRYKQNWPIVDAKTNVTSVNETLERPIQEHHGGLIYVFIIVSALVILCVFLIIYCCRKHFILTWCTYDDGQNKKNVKLEQAKLSSHYGHLMYQESKEATIKDEFTLLRPQEEL